MTNTVLVTGTSSFVGAHLARTFADAGYAVTATHSRPLKTYDGIRAERLAFAGTAARLAQLDITDSDAVRDIVKNLEPEIWVHHAGHAADYASPDYDADRGAAINVTPLGAIFDAMKGCSGGVVITGSSAEYASSDIASREDDTAKPDTPYGRSKLAETDHALQLSEKTGIPVRIGRLYIPFGRLDHPQKLLAQVIDGLTNGTPVDLSPCIQRRDFIGVADVCRAWVALAKDLSAGGAEVYNICSGEATELRTLLLKIAAEMEVDGNLLRFGARPMRPGEPPVSFGDNAKARNRLNWTPRSLARAIAEDLFDAAAITAATP